MLAALALSVLLVARRWYPAPVDMETGGEREGLTGSQRFPRAFWLYLAFVTFSVAGYATFQLISYHFEAAAVVPVAQIPLLFALAMGVDALVALVAGQLFDRIRLIALLAVPILGLLVSPLAFSASYGAALAAVVLWGAVMGIQETVMRAAVADMIPAARRGMAYGIFNAAYGLFWFLGGALMGLLYEASVGYLVAFSVGMELISLPALILLAKESFGLSGG